MPAGNQQFSYLVDTEFFSKMESADIHAGKVSVELNVKHDGDIFDLSFKMNGEIIISCDRCLDDMPLNVDTDYHLVVKYGEEYNDESDEPEYTFFEWAKSTTLLVNLTFLANGSVDPSIITLSNPNLIALFTTLSVLP